MVLSIEERTVFVAQSLQLEREDSLMSNACGLSGLPRLSREPHCCCFSEHPGHVDGWVCPRCCCAGVAPGFGDDLERCWNSVIPDGFDLLRPQEYIDVMK